jgi:hypothetical protein
MIYPMFKPAAGEKVLCESWLYFRIKESLRKASFSV